MAFPTRPDDDEEDPAMITFPSMNTMADLAAVRLETTGMPGTPGVPGTPLATHSQEQPDTERIGDEIARLAAHLHAATYRLLLLIREFDEREGWGWGFRTCAEWLSWRTGIAPGAAREKVRVARALASLPQISEGMARGELSYSKVRALTRVATPENEGELLEVAQHGTAAHIERLVRAWRRVDRIEEAEGERERHQSRYLRLHAGEDGSYVIRGRLDPEVGALLEQALKWASEALYRREARAARDTEGSREGGGLGARGGDGREETTTGAQRRADAMGLLAERAMIAASEYPGPRPSWEEPGSPHDVPEPSPDDRVTVWEVLDRSRQDPEPWSNSHEPSSDHPGHLRDDPEPPPGEKGCTPTLGRADRFQVVLHVDAGALEEGSEDGPGILEESGLGVPAETSRRLACDASVVEMTHGSEGDVLSVGRKRRTIPPAIRRALEHRDRGCSFPGCGCRYTDAHHVVHWADGGETKLNNLVLLCRVHHRMVHEEGVRVELVECAGDASRGGGSRRWESGGEARFYRPDGRQIPVVPEPPLIPWDAVPLLVRNHEELGIEPDDWTATPLWHGETFDCSLALDMLRHTLARARQAKRTAVRSVPAETQGGGVAAETWAEPERMRLTLAERVGHSVGSGKRAGRGKTGKD